MTVDRTQSLATLCGATLLVCVATSATPQDTHISTYGTPGLIDMPTAEQLEDGLLLPTVSYAGGMLKQTLTFQVTPRISGSFRYTTLKDFDLPVGNRYDRSFDFFYQILKEGKRRPALAVGLRDFGGTGIYSSEYLVATKNFGDRLGVTAGMGWGRLAGVGGFNNPLSVLSDHFDERGSGPTNINEVGRLETDQWFRGDAAIFGGLTYKLNDRFTFAAEYSTDTYAAEVERMSFDNKSQFNFAATYNFRNGNSIGAYSLQGSEYGLMLTLPTHPNRPARPGAQSKSPPPILPQSGAVAAQWQTSDGGVSTGQRQFLASLESQGLKAEGLDINASTATLQVRNDTYGADAQALGRAARVMANTLPAQIKTFKVVLSKQGMPVTVTTLRRSDIEALDHDIDGSWKSFARADISDARGLVPERIKSSYPILSYSLSPYLQTSLFDPDNPFRADLGIQASASIQPLRGFVLSGTVRQPLAGNLDTITRESNSILPHVRSDAGKYAVLANTELNHLTAEYFFRPAANTYARITAGYLESMYGGVSGEVLWYPTDSRLALGAELNYARQRDFDQLLGFQDYDVVTGHASAYYDFGNGFLAQLDAGRYLASDWGATVGLDREFNNGFKVGAFFTLTDVPFDEFGEGSFDKGIRITLPVDWITGNPSQTNFGTTIRPVQRDGGARLNVRNRLFETVRGAQSGELEDRWGVFWR